VTLREANGICREVLNNHLNDRSAKAEAIPAKPRLTENPVRSGEVETEELPQTTTETTNIKEQVTELPSASTVDGSANGKLKRFLKIQFLWQYLLSQKCLLYSLRVPWVVVTKF
jgi:hypothetical protein